MFWLIVRWLEPFFSGTSPPVVDDIGQARHVFQLRQLRAVSKCGIIVFDEGA
jgi:hypothetical protein